MILKYSTPETSITQILSPRISHIGKWKYTQNVRKTDKKLILQGFLRDQIGWNEKYKMGLKHIFSSFLSVSHHNVVISYCNYFQLTF